MKKILISLLSILLLTGCASQGLKEDKVLYAIKGVETKDSDFYNSMKLGDDGTIIINKSRKEVIDNAEVNEEELNKMIQANLDQLTAMFGDNLLAYIQNFGFKTVEEFVEKQVRPSLVLETLARETLRNEKDSILTTYQYKKIEYIATSKKETLEQALVSINNGAKISDIELDESAKFFSETHTKSSEVASKTLSAYIKGKQKEGMSDILFDEESNLYFIINNLPIDLETELDTVIDTIIQKENYMTTFSGQLFIDNGFKVYDKNLLSKMKNSFPTYLK